MANWHSVVKKMLVIDIAAIKPVEQQRVNEHKRDGASQRDQPTAAPSAASHLRDAALPVPSPHAGLCHAANFNDTFWLTVMCATAAPSNSNIILRGLGNAQTISVKEKPDEIWKKL